MHKLVIKNLTASIDEKIILNNFNLEIKSGEIHVIMGPNGTGKSTLSKIIMGDCNYKILEGDIYYDDKSIKEMSTDERARIGIFLGMQSPPEIEGVTTADFLRTAIHIKNGQNFKLMQFIHELEETVEKLKMDPSMIHRAINQGFSGGEKKKNEILQMYLLKPTTIILDEIDSGLDLDALKIVGENVMNYYQNNDCGILLITHYQRLLDYIKPDYVHIMMNGQIIKTGSINLVSELEEKGYDSFLKADNNE